MADKIEAGAHQKALRFKGQDPSIDADTRIMQRAEETMRKKYGDDEALKRIWRFGRILREELGSLESVKGMRVLDLGCGSVIPGGERGVIEELLKRKQGGTDISEDVRLLRKKVSLDGVDFMSGKISRRYEPWFCRLALELGAHPVGIDTGNLDGEEFEHYQIDLSKPGALAFLPERSFDVVHSRLLRSSTQFNRMGEHQNHDAIFAGILQEANRVLKKDGRLMVRE